MNTIIIVGAGRFARELLCWLEDSLDPITHRIGGLLDDTLAPAPQLDDDYPYPVLGGIMSYVPAPDDVFLLAIGAPAARLQIAATLTARGAQFYTLIHPSAIVARTARLGRGVIVCPFALVSAGSRVGDFVTINSYSSVGHDAVLGDGCTLSSHVDLTGAVQLGAAVMVGSGASVLPRVQVGARATVGAGAVVMRRVAEGATVYAQPAKTL